MEKVRWRALSLAVVSALVLSGSLVATQGTAAAGATSDGLLAHYEFTEASGSVLADSSGSGRSASVVGTPVWTSASLQLSGAPNNASRVDLPDGLLAGRTDATISVEVKPTAATLTRDNFLWNVGGTSTSTSGTGSWFVAPRDRIRTAITRTNWRGEQSIGWDRTLTAGTWQNVTATIKKNADGSSTLRLFVDGTQRAVRENSTVGLADLTDHTNTVLGGAAYADSLGFAGEFAEARIYGRALEASEIQEISQADAASTSNAVLAGLNLGDTTAVTDDISLPSAATWSSSDPAVISSTGAVTRPAAGQPAATATLTAVVTVRGQSAERTFSVTVLPEDGEPDPEGPYEPTWESLSEHDASPEWFRDAKFGVYWHWGAFTTPQYGSEWYGRYVYGQTSVRDFHTRTYGAPEVWGYENFIDGAPDLQGQHVQFKPVLKSQGGQFDPSAWLDVVEASGAKFAGPVAEHHDGYSMWDSEVNEWNSVDRGPKLDLLKIFADEVRKRDLKLLVAMHQAFNTNGFFKDAPRQTDPSLQKLYGQLPKEESDQLWFDKQREVVDHVQPDIIWNDFGLDSPGYCHGGSDICGIDEQQRLKFLAYYFNRGAEWGKEVLTTYKHFDSGFRDDSAVADWERGGPADISRPYWLTDDAISASSWSYTNGIRYYSSKQMLHSLIDRVSKGGNMLLNVSPTAAGVLPQEQEAVLRDIGAYLERYGESIYSTRAWDIYGEGPNTAGGGSFTAPLTGDGRDIRFTRNKAEDTLYATMLGWPGESVSIQSLGGDSVDLAGLRSVTLVDATGGNVDIDLADVQQSDQALTIDLPAQPATSLAYVLKLSFEDHIPTPQRKTGASVFPSADGTGNGASLGEGTFNAVYLEEAGMPAPEIQSLRVSPDTTVRAYASSDLTGEATTFGPGVHTVAAGTIGSLSTVPDNSGLNKITSVVNSLRLDVDGAPAAGSRITQQAADDNDTAQVFDLQQVAETSDGLYYRIVHRDSGLAIDGMGRGSGSYVELQAPSPALSQQFRLVSGTSGAFNIVNRQVDVALDSGGSVPAGSFLKQWSRNGSPNLLFRVEPVEQRPVVPAPTARYDMSHSGTSLLDVSGNGRNATLTNLTDSSFVRVGQGDDVLRFKADGYASLPTGLVTGTDNDFTVEYTVTTQTAANHFGWVIGDGVGAFNTTQLGNHVFLSPRSAQSGYTNQVLAAIRVKSGTDNGESRMPAGGGLNPGFTTLTMVGSGQTLTLYRDGVQISTLTHARSLSSIIPSGSVLGYLGRSLYSNDPLLRADVTDVKFWDSALTADQVSSSMPAPAVKKASTDGIIRLDITPTVLGTNPSLDQVTSNLTLPASSNGVGLTWASSNPAVVSTTGVVSRSIASDTPVTLTATTSLGTTIALDVVVKAPNLSADLDAISLPARTTENLPLAVKGAVNGGAITWTSSDPALVTPTDAAYTAPPVGAADPYAGGGIVTRPAYGEGDEQVALTATVTLNGQTRQRTFSVVVAEKGRRAPDAGYAAAYFKSDSDEKIYQAATSGNDFFTFSPVNGGQPVITSTADTTGLRDPYILRSKDGDKYYMIATDLCIRCTPGSWAEAQSKGSLKIEVWESTDLVHWARTNGGNTGITINQPAAGMTWAPEAYWDDDLQSYVVFFASRLYSDASHTNTDKLYARMFYVLTRDFRTFTYPPASWQDTGYARIDSTVTKIGDYYYRFTKNEDSGAAGALEAGKDIFLERSKVLTAPTSQSSWSADPNATWQLTDTRMTGLETGQAGEGPEIVKLNEGDPNNNAAGDGYVFLVDNYSAGGYRAFVTSEGAIASSHQGDRLSQRADWNVRPIGGLPASPRHGAFVSVSQTVLDALHDWTDVAAVASTTQLTADGRTATAEVTADDDGDVVGAVTFSGGSWSQTVDLHDGTASVTVPAGVTAVTAHYDGYTDGLVSPSISEAVTFALELTATAATRCVAGKIVEVVNVTNDDDVTATVTIAGTYGTKTVTVAAGTTTSVSFATRAVSIAAHDVTVTARAADGRTHSSTVRVAAATCG